MTPSNLIQASELELETSISKEILRKWRLRYGFPTPITLQDGTQGFSRDQINQLRLIKRLLDAGFKPSLIVGKPIEYLERMVLALGEAGSCGHWSPTTESAISLLKNTDIEGLSALLDEERKRHSLTGFVQKIVSPLMDAVGEAWSQGVIAVYQEHLCTDVVIRHLSSALANTRSQKDQPRILLATPTDELHALGMLMARCVLSDQGATCIGVGPQTPMSELAAAATSWKADIVGVSFSFSYPTQRVRPLITHLRTLLPSRVSIWVGGSGAKHLQQEPPEGVQVFLDLQSPLDALKAWPHG